MYVEIFDYRFEYINSEPIVLFMENVEFFKTKSWKPLSMLSNKTQLASNRRKAVPFILYKG